MLLPTLTLLLAVGQVEKGAPPSVLAIREQIQKAIAAKEIAGAVTLVATPEGVVHLDASGNAGLPDESMRTDAIFWIASMSKPILGVLIAMLQDDGLLNVDDPVEKYLPEFKNLKTQSGKPANLTIRHLLTHTSGLGEISGEQAKACKTLSDVIPLYLAKPVAFEPGSKWVYCQSGINTAGRIAEVVTKEPIDKLLQRRLFGPLGMKDTTFYLTEQQLPRLAKAYKRTAAGELEVTPNFFLNGKSPTSTDRFPAPNGGLFSTASDYGRFCRMILRGGELDGKRYLKAETVKQIMSVQSGDVKTGFTPGNSWGLAWCVVREPQGVSAALSPGSAGHGGAYGTQAWVDPTAKRAYVLMVQRANFPNSDASDVRRGFQEAAAAALGSPQKK
jgi:CubicO group peptidase (beta-lactamase class C family)